MFFFSLRNALLCAFFLTVFFLNNTFAGEDWKPISPEELAMKAPTIEADAEAEALLWEVYVADELDGSVPRTVLRHYLRFKIFTEKGREDNSKVDIPFGRLYKGGVEIKIKDIAARTVKPDGTIIELNPKDIFERDIIKGNNLKLRAKSFALPGIEVGSIIEYRWKETRGDTFSYYERLHIAREIPVHNVIYHVKPLSVPGFDLGMRIQTFNSQNPPFKKEKDGYFMTSFSNVPSFKEEPNMPPEYAVRPWLLVYYSEDSKLVPEKYWLEHGKSTYENHKPMIKVNDDIKKATAEAIGDAAEPMQKIEKIFNYVRAKIKNYRDDALGLTPDQLKQIKDNKNAGDVLKRGIGDWHDIDMLFAAMVTAAGFEVRVTNLARRSDIDFSPQFTDDYFLRTENIAVKVGEDWKFFDPASSYVPFGMLSWEEEGQAALISDSKNPAWSQTPYSTAEKSMEKRTGKFKLLEDGTLEGEARVEFTGHLAVERKEYNDEDTPAQREQTLKNYVRSNILGSADVTNFTIENVTDPDKPFIYTFKIRVPGYATRTGKRLFFQPNVFERNSRPVFTAGTRRYDVRISHAWSESDDITIELPNGYSLESPDVPATAGDSQGISSDDVKISVTKDGKTLIYKREFFFGNKSIVHFPVKSYQAVKGLFDAFYKVNTHQLTLKTSVVQ